MPRNAPPREHQWCPEANRSGGGLLTNQTFQRQCAGRAQQPYLERGTAEVFTLRIQEPLDDLMLYGVRWDDSDKKKSLTDSCQG